jgi:group I intron endonuclease
MEERQYKVYKIGNKISGKFYIGYTKDIKKRFKSHISHLVHNNHGNIILQRSYNKHGISNFTFEVIDEFDNINECKEKELEYLSDLHIRPKLYNIHYNNSGGDVISNHPDRLDIIKRMTCSIRERYSKMSKEEKKLKHGQNGEKNGMFGRTHTPETRKRLSARIVSKETREKMSARIVSKETRERISVAASKRTGIKNSMYGKTYTEEYKKIMSERNKGRPGSNNVAITVENVNYDSLTHASKVLNIPVSTVLFRVKSKNEKFKNYHYTDISTVKTQLNTKVQINGVKYNSITEVCKYLDLCNEYVTNKIKSVTKENEEWKIIDEKRDKILRYGKKVEVHGIQYNSILDASKALGINEAYLAKLLNSKTPVLKSNKKRISIDNIEYNSLKEASKLLEKNINTICSRLKSSDEKWKDYIYLPDEYHDLTKYKYV